MNNQYEYFCPYSNKIIKEEMYFGKTLHFFYGDILGRILLVTIFKRIWWGFFYRLYKKSFLSKKSIDRDIKRFMIKMDEYEIEKWSSYNHFFIRKFKNGVRKFDERDDVLCVFAEGKYLIYDTGETSSIVIKNQKLKIKDLLDCDLISNFENSYLIVARLCPTDYHRYHYPINGFIEKSRLVKGGYDSVNIFAQEYNPKILFENKRWVSILSSDFGKIGFVEIGGMSVATIKNEHKKGYLFKKGEEKGHFEYGGSSIILILPKDKFQIREDLLHHSDAGREVYLKLGDFLAKTSVSKHTDKS